MEKYETHFERLVMCLDLLESLYASKGNSFDFDGKS